MTIAIHQPNFIPWWPFFQKTEQCDRFVIMSHCQFEKNNFQNRFFHDGRWNTMPVKGGTELIKDKKYHFPYSNWVDLEKKYKKLSLFDDLIGENVAKTNSGIIKRTCEFLNISTEIVHDYPTELVKTARLVDICLHFGATKYLSGPSGKKYLDLKLFSEHGIEVIFQDESKTIKKSLIEIL
jgi:hypothetical protein